MTRPVGAGLLCAAAAAACTTLAARPVRADWREVHLSLSGGPALGRARYGELDGSRTGPGGTAGLDASYALRNDLEVGVQLRAGLVRDLVWSSVRVPNLDGRSTVSGRLEAESRLLVLLPTVRFVHGDNRTTWFAGAGAGVAAVRTANRVLTDPQSGQTLYPFGARNLPETRTAGAAAAVGVGLELRLRTHLTFAVGVEALAALDRDHPTFALAVPITLGYRWYP